MVLKIRSNGRSDVGILRDMMVRKTMRGGCNSVNA